MILVHLFKVLFFKALKSLLHQVFLVSAGGLGASHQVATCLLPPSSSQVFFLKGAASISLESRFLNWLFQAAWPHVTSPNTCTSSAHSAPIPAARYRPCLAPQLPLP